jgi:4-amino-4-deoxy-L-arabinose transferase-like glycosyltransferase
MEKRMNIVFWLFTLSVLIILVLPNLMKYGMFMDGLLYSTVANNFAQGKGSFWHLFNSITLHTDFHEQPPLYFWIMAGFYKIFGNSVFVERFYDFFMLLLSAFLIHKNWQIIASKKFAKYSFLPVLFWITIPVCFWAYSNNMLEITVSVFALSSSYYLFKYYFKEKRFVYLIVAGIFLIAGGLTKGFVALFPLAIPFAYYLIFQSFHVRKWILETFFLSLIPLLVIGLIFSFETSRSGFSTYLTQRVFHSIEKVSTVDNRFYILKRLFFELLPMIGVNVLIFGIRFFKKKENHWIFDKKTFFLLFIALSASVPIMITKEQRGFYLVNSLSYYAMMVAWATMPMWQKKIQYLEHLDWLVKWGRTIGIILVVTTLSFSFLQIGKYSRDEKILKDIQVIKPVLSNENIISITTTIKDRWNVHSYFMRFMGISLDDRKLHNFFLTLKNELPDDTVNYRKITVNTSVFDLYYCQK